MTYYEIQEKRKYPEWFKNRMTYQEDEMLLKMLIKENENWIKYYKIRKNFSNVVLHKERILELEELLNNLDENCKING